MSSGGRVVGARRVAAGLIPLPPNGAAPRARSRRLLRGGGGHSEKQGASCASPERASVNWVPLEHSLPHPRSPQNAMQKTTTPITPAAGRQGCAAASWPGQSWPSRRRVPPPSSLPPSQRANRLLKRRESRGTSQRSGWRLTWGAGRGAPAAGQGAGATTEHCRRGCRCWPAGEGRLCGSAEDEGRAEWKDGAGLRAQVGQQGYR